MSEATQCPAVEPQDLTLFQHELLLVLADAQESLYGLEIKRRLQTTYQQDINHGRLYPNIDDLVEMGLIERRERAADLAEQRRRVEA